VFPLLVGLFTYTQARPHVGATAQLRSIHPAPPSQITFRGRSVAIAGLENPLRHEGSLEEHARTGRRIYYQNCLPCHGDLLDGLGHFAHGFNPAPLAFDDAGTIDQLQESFLFWRIAKGGPGLPPEGTPWNSAMPVWENYLTENEIWSVIIFLYQQSGLTPRTWDEEPAQ
jgi:mono/diheme cytochrome c family protein